ncbi:unnamed protein product [Ostreobium quekettii]|uniref:Uncharacterized protein n=1 Tax=Ostreobium quekettii TaxID=121088 RepID=A0A8S1IZ77_9CHLO|nr:unnamed protein product [Ostreobium quekettii]|eukprot:evm.model.scf_115EXC.6 EVM.evm.TU.scf_115EXC.6   scf_115EXC:39831-44726(-)
MTSPCELQLTWQDTRSEAKRATVLQEIGSHSQAVPSPPKAPSAQLDSRSQHQDCNTNWPLDGAPPWTSGCGCAQPLRGHVQLPASPTLATPKPKSAPDALPSAAQLDPLARDCGSARKDNIREAGAQGGSPLGGTSAATSSCPVSKTVSKWCGEALDNQPSELGPSPLAKHTQGVGLVEGSSQDVSASFTHSEPGWKILEGNVLRSSSSGQSTRQPGVTSRDAREGSASIIEQEIISSTTDSQNWNVTDVEQPIISSLTSASSKLSFEELACLPPNHPEVLAVLQHPDAGPLTRVALVGTSKPERKVAGYDPSIIAKLGWDDEYCRLDWEHLDWVVLGQNPLKRRSSRVTSASQPVKQSRQTSSSDSPCSVPGFGGGEMGDCGYGSARDDDSKNASINRVDVDSQDENDDDHEARKAALKRSRRRLRVDSDRQTLLARIVSAQIRWCKGRGKACRADTDRRPIVQDERVLAGLCKDLRDNRGNRAALVFSLCMFSEPSILIDRRAAISTGLVDVLNDLVRNGDSRVRSLANEILRAKMGARGT